jgi:hypothetical protein
MSKRINRRIFLRGLGGAVVAAPLLSSIGDRPAKALATASPARRLIVMYTHYGCLTTRFFPEKSHGALSNADFEGRTIAPLAPYASKLLLPRGIRSMNEWTADLSRGQGNDQHIQASGSFFTCQPLTPNSDEPFSFATNTRFAPRPMGRSLDHVIAEQLSSDKTPLFLRVGGYSENVQSQISYSGPEQAYPGLGPLTQAYSLLTGLFASGGGAGSAPLNPDSYQAIRGKSILDLVADDLDTLERFDMSQRDRLKLDAWKELLHETGTGVQTAQCSAETAAALGLTAENIQLSNTSDSNADRLTRRISGEMDAADLYSRMAVLAAVCNLNPVIFLKYPGNFVFKGLGLTLESHGLSHRIGNAGLQGTCVADVLNQIWSIDRYYAQKFANLVGQLDAMYEGEGTLLDSCAAVWFQEVADGLAHNHNNLPIVQAGGGGGYFKTGWSINVEDGSPDLPRGESERFCADPADTSTSFTSAAQETGTDPAYGNAPINKYFCNLMNMLGVKAGEDGFPLAGGEAEVTKFGMYDKTEDFVGGGTNPPMIHSPGGFDSLKANG